MPKIQYKSINFHGSTLETVDKALVIIKEYADQGFDLTLRQLFYQCVTRGFIPNSTKAYDRLGSIISDARLAGLVDWNSITDRTRSLKKMTHWDSPEQIIAAAAKSYHNSLWASQAHRVEVWIEKDALSGVFQGVCESNDVPYFPCRGYTSQTEMWGAARRFRNYIENGQTVRILHFGDHDPSGVDMTRDIHDRLRMFLAHDLIEHDDGEGTFDNELDDWFQIDRIALNSDQIEQYDLPPNPVKESDARWKKYVEETGFHESWEL